MILFGFHGMSICVVVFLDTYLNVSVVITLHVVKLVQSVRGQDDNERDREDSSENGLKQFDIGVVVFLIECTSEDVELNDHTFEMLSN